MRLASSGLGRTLLVAAILCGFFSLATAGPLRERLKELKAERQSAQADDPDESDEGPAAVSVPAGVRVLRDVAYGSDAKQRFDVYLPPHAGNAPIIVMVHGGGWRRGDKRMSGVVQNKMQRWVGKGFIFVSVNYRLLPTDVLTQAQDVASAVAMVQQKAASWGGDPDRLVLIGHSAGAHLSALLAASPAIAAQGGARPWLGTVALDSAALDVASIMEKRHVPMYDAAFGSDPAYWKRASPFHVLSADARPMLMVCSTQRRASCSQAQAFADKAMSIGVSAQVSGQDLTHGEINAKLGAPGAYTDAVESFLSSLDPSLGQLLR